MSLYDHCRERLRTLLNEALSSEQKRRVSQAPPKFAVLFQGDSWTRWLASDEGKLFTLRTHTRLWNQALCDLIATLSEQNKDLADRVEELEKKLGASKDP